ncbi:MAG: ATP-binding cassette, subfamily B, bacterial [Parcubacteria group bacterium Gr01-1014_20]|nr:MAG: ATP-binding cassette, subfamily B, bacterial [Parcubacteria group bacterium Gr01-1014_20]
MSLIIKYLKQNKKLLFGALFLGTINQVFSLLDPQIFRLIIDNYATQFSKIPSSDFFNGVILLLLASIGVAFVSRVAKNFQDYYVNVITQRVGARMYGESVAHSFSLPYAVFEDQRSGELLQKLQKARIDAQAFITSSINILFLSLISIVFVLSYAFFVHWSLGLAYFSVIPIMGVTTYFISRRVKDAQKKIVLETAELAGSTTETIRNVELVKSLGLESQETERLNNVNEKILSLELKKVRLIRKLSFIQGTLVNALRSGILFLMLYLIFKQVLTLGEFFSILFYSFYVFNPLGELGNVAAQFQESKASSEALQEVLKIKPEPVPVNPKAINSIKSITFDKLNFSYNQDQIHSIDSINLKINSGETIAFVGPSGSGKSTLIKMMVGLYKPTRGRLLVNDINLTEVNPKELRSKIGYVAQETQLFAGTIRDNLIFVNPSATDEECKQALKAAAAISIIERGDKGLDTKIGEGGIKISGGERQRLAIARALLRNPEILIFDEATSSLDSITEKSITETIKKISKIRPNLITVLVAHRLSTVSHANKIFVLEKGEVVEEGNHAKLLRLKGLYAALWREQSGEKDV